MFSTNTMVIGKEGDKVKVRASIISTEGISTMPADGSGVYGLPVNAIFDAGSTILVVPTAELYFYGTDKAWHLFGEGA